MRCPFAFIRRGTAKARCKLKRSKVGEFRLNYFRFGRNISVLNIETFQAANPFIAFEPIEEIPVDDFFARLEKRDAAWTELKNYLEANLISLKVFKVRNIRREVYAVGLFQGHIVGIRTFAVET